MMKAILVDDEYYLLDQLVHECKQIEELEIVGAFDGHERALACAVENAIDVAFLDIEMPVMDGIALAAKLREIHPDLVVIYVTAHDETEVDIKRDGHTLMLAKPFRRQDVEGVMGKIE